MILTFNPCGAVINNDYLFSYINPFQKRYRQSPGFDVDTVMVILLPICTLVIPS